MCVGGLGSGIGQAVLDRVEHDLEHGHVERAALGIVEQRARVVAQEGRGRRGDRLQKHDLRAGVICHLI